MQARSHSETTGRCLFCDVIAAELRDGRRIVAENASFVAVIPFFARYPYETHIYAKRHMAALSDFTRGERRDLAELLKMLLVAFDGLFDLSFPYIMALKNRPSDGQNYDYFHFHIEFYPPHRTANKLKYLAGSEAGAGMFINDTRPEEKAPELRAHVRPVVWKGGRRD